MPNFNFFFYLTTFSSLFLALLSLSTTITLAAPPTEQVILSSNLGEVTNRTFIPRCAAFDEFEYFDQHHGAASFHRGNDSDLDEVDDCNGYGFLENYSDCSDDADLIGLFELCGFRKLSTDSLEDEKRPSSNIFATGKANESDNEDENDSFKQSESDNEDENESEKVFIAIQDERPLVYYNPSSSLRVIPAYSQSRSTANYGYQTTTYPPNTAAALCSSSFFANQISNGPIQHQQDGDEEDFSEEDQQDEYEDEDEYEEDQQDEDDGQPAMKKARPVNSIRIPFDITMVIPIIVVSPDSALNIPSPELQEQNPRKRSFVSPSNEALQVAI